MIVVFWVAHRGRWIDGFGIVIFHKMVYFEVESLDAQVENNFELW